MWIRALLFFFTGLVIYNKMSGTQICDRSSPSSARGPHSPLRSSHWSEEKVRFYEVSKMRFKVSQCTFSPFISRHNSKLTLWNRREMHNETSRVSVLHFLAVMNEFKWIYWPEPCRFVRLLIIVGVGCNSIIWTCILIASATV